MKLTQKKANGPVLATAYSDQHIGPYADDLLKAAQHMIGAEADLAEFRAAIAKDKRLAKLVDALPGYKHMRGPDLWTMMLSSLVAQQISGAAARSIRDKLARTYGHVVRTPTEDVAVVPSAERLFELSETELRGVGLSQKKAEYARGMAEALLNGTIVPERLREMSPDEMIRTLSALRGVGVWTAECIG